MLSTQWRKQHNSCKIFSTVCIGAVLSFASSITAVDPLERLIGPADFAEVISV